MARALRTQADDLGDEYTAATAINFDPSDPDARSVTRQEFKTDADINTILRKFGVDAFNKQPIFGDINYDVTLQDALHLLTRANELHRRLPESLRAKYPDRGSILLGLDDGTFQADLEAADNPPPTPAPAPTPAEPPA